MTPTETCTRARLLATVTCWPCLLSTPIRVMTDTREPPGRSPAHPPLYDRAPAMAPATGLEGEAVMLAAPRQRGASSVAVIGERAVIREMAHRGGRRVLEVATIDGHGRLVPAIRSRSPHRGAGP